MVAEVVATAAAVATTALAYLRCHSARKQLAEPSSCQKSFYYCPSHAAVELRAASARRDLRKLG